MPKKTSSKYSNPCVICGSYDNVRLKLQVSNKPPNTPDRWICIGYACQHLCAEKAYQSIEDSKQFKYLGGINDYVI